MFSQHGFPQIWCYSITKWQQAANSNTALWLMLLYYNSIIQEGYCYSIWYFTFCFLERISSAWLCLWLFNRTWWFNLERPNPTQRWHKLEPRANRFLGSTPLTHLLRRSNTWGSPPPRAACTRRPRPPGLCFPACLSDGPPRPEEPPVRHAGCPDRPTEESTPLLSVCCFVPNAWCAVRIRKPAYPSPS